MMMKNRVNEIVIPVKGKESMKLLPASFIEDRTSETDRRGTIAPLVITNEFGL